MTGTKKKKISGKMEQSPLKIVTGCFELHGFDISYGDWYSITCYSYYMYNTPSCKIQLIVIYYFMNIINLRRPAVKACKRQPWPLRSSAFFYIYIYIFS